MNNSLYIPNHFGLGQNPTQKLETNLLDEFAKYETYPEIFANSLKTPEILQKFYEIQDERKEDKEAAQKLRGQFVRSINLPEQNKRTQYALITPTPFLERIMHFWSNHFAISIEKIIMRPLGNAYEIEAIRPNITGNFRDLLIGVITHPAMLIYLDQANSIGPNSQFAQRRKARSDKKIGLNENLAREILELHTLGVHGGYSQEDVTQFAKALTGFTIINQQRMRFGNLPMNAQIGQFAFEPAIHEPDDVNFMGKHYNGQGAKNAAQILEFIATHPATYAHIAFKLARHFAGDNPPQELIDKLKQNLIANNGDLKSLYRELIASPFCYNKSAIKFKTPYEWLVSSLRAMNVSDLEKIDIAVVLKNLGQELWLPKSPKGYDDTMDAWAAPDALMRRIEAANLIAKYINAPLPPVQLAQKILGDELSEHTLTSISRAESVQSGIALLLVSPEFLRR